MSVNPPELPAAHPTIDVSLEPLSDHISIDPTRIDIDPPEKEVVQAVLERARRIVASETPAPSTVVEARIDQWAAVMLIDAVNRAKEDGNLVRPYAPVQIDNLLHAADAQLLEGIRRRDAAKRAERLAARRERVRRFLLLRG